MKIFLFLASILVLGILVNTIDSAYSHGISCGMTSGNVRIEDETYSVQISTTDDSFTISGTIVGIQNEENTPLGIFVRSKNLNDPYLQSVHDLIYGKGMRDANHANWYFKYDANPKEISIKEGDVIDYKITVNPLKAGEYHIHTYLSNTERCGWAPGQTIHVEGRDGITDGEIFGFYFPFMSGVIGIIFAVIIGIIGIRRKLKKYHSSKGSLV